MDAAAQGPGQEPGGEVAPSAPAPADHTAAHPGIGGELHRSFEWTQSHLAPAWSRVTDGEARWPATATVIAAILLQLALPKRLTLGQTWIVPASEGALLLALIVINPGRISRRSSRTRAVSLILIAAMTVANTWSAARLVRGLVNGTEGSDPTKLLTTGAAIWLTNVVVFCLWYWEFDRGGPGARAEATHSYPDFVFPQMQAPDLSPENWEPTFVDYLYLSFTNATAFSPTDTLPFTRWAKLTMMAQSAVSLITVGLVIARAVNILK